jgi:hypothetical protein
VSIYLARYVKGGPFANTQIARASAGEVVFRYTPHSDGQSAKHSGALKVSPTSFLARVLAHAPEPHRHTLRYYGLYAHACAEQLNAARAVHRQVPAATPAPIQWHNYLARFARSRAATHCPRCHAALVRGALIAARRAPP